MSIKKGARSVAHSFNSQVGIGSSSHCLIGASAIKQYSSFTDVTVKAYSSLDDFDVIGGGNAAAVDARIFSTFSLKNVALFLSSPQIVFSDLHSRRGLPRCEFILSCTES